MDRITKNTHSYITPDQGVYMIWSKIKPLAQYTGSSTNIRRRYREHYLLLAKGTHYNKKLQNHVNKYGLEDLEFCVKFTDNNISVDRLREIEEEEIKFFNHFTTGLNLSEGTKSPTWTKESRKILSDKARLRQSDPEVKLKLSLKYRGTKSSTSKLTTEDIKYIKENCIFKGNKCMNIRILAEKFKVCTWTIQRMLHGRTYKND